MLRRTFFALTAATALSGAAFAGGHSKDIVDTAVDAGSFTTLVAAVQAAGLVDTLKGEGPFTVFAPTDEAFAALPEGTVETLLKPENKDQLVSILTYHVVSGNITASDVASALKKGYGKAELTTLNGGTLTAVQKDGGIFLMDANGNYSKISKTDVMASNGVIHIIDDVVMPK